MSWHYRSRHESLIAFSNVKYYRGELTTFPSPVTRDTAVRYIHVEGGVYERGGAKVNRKEAEAVVAEVVRRMRTSTHSIGVVTFNGEQQRLIENLLDQARRADPSLEPHFDRNQTREPILVKNIENVQGDERDVIIFSVAVGPDKTGRVTAQISSLNNEGGHRRLNVAVILPSFEHMLEDLLPVIAAIDDPKVIREIGVFDQWALYFAPTNRSVALFDPLIPHAGRGPLLYPFLPACSLHDSIDEAAHFAFETLKQIERGVGALKVIFFGAIFFANQREQLLG